MVYCRYIAAGAAMGDPENLPADPILLLNKIDLVDDYNQALIDQIDREYRGWSSVSCGRTKIGQRMLAGKKSDRRMTIKPADYGSSNRPLPA